MALVRKVPREIGSRRQAYAGAVQPLDLPELRKARGAFFTPPAIADFLAAWAVSEDKDARVLDPTCGDGVFLLAAARQLKALGCSPAQLDERVFGSDLHEPSLEEAMRLLEDEGLDGHLIADDFFNLASPSQLGCVLPEMDAVIGNPPFVRYQQHVGDARKRSASAALAQGVRLNGLASSWAALVVHACGFLKPEGRLAMVLPAELLTVNYAEPVRRWLRRRFAAVNLVMFNQLQFDDALEKVILVVARGSGGCDAFSLFEVDDAADLPKLGAFDHFTVTPSAEGKWTDLLLTVRQRQLFKKVAGDHFAPLNSYGSPELGTVTGANSFFAISESTRKEFKLDEEKHLVAISPPGTRHLKGLTFTPGQWETLRQADEKVWLLHPEADDKSKGLARYLDHGEELGVPDAYKCKVRAHWFRPPIVSAPDLFFTYMSHRYPRLITNSAGVTFLNSMHGVRLQGPHKKLAKTALPLLALNSVTMLGAELYGRSYGGGILKMEPSEAATLPVPSPQVMAKAWETLKHERDSLDRQLKNGFWTTVVSRVDEVLLQDAAGLSAEEIAELHEATHTLRARRIGRDAPASDDT
jgi:adenine-specific DNA-methyltransferase